MEYNYNEEYKFETENNKILESNDNNITQARLKQMCKYFQGKLVSISYKDNNAKGGIEWIEYKGRYDSFILITHSTSYSGINYKIKFVRKNDIIFTYKINNGVFVGLGSIDSINNDIVLSQFRIVRI